MTGKSNIQQKIINVLIGSKKLLGLEDIIRETGLSRDAVINNITILLESNPAVRCVYVGKRKKYYYRDPDTLFGIPVDRATKEQISRIAGVIRSESTNMGIVIGKTAMQKLLWKLNKKFNLGLPFVDYMFGKMLVYTPLKGDAAEDNELSADKLEFIRETILRYGNMNRDDIAEEQYREENMVNHSLMLRMRKSVEHGKAETIVVLSNKLARLLASDSMYGELELVLDIPYYIERVGGSITPDIRELVNKVLKRVSMSLLRNSLISDGYEKALAEEYLRPEIEKLDEEIEEVISDIEKKHPLRVSVETRKLEDDIRTLYLNAKKSSGA